MNHSAPPALLKAIWLTALIGAGCLGLGILYFLKTKDRVLLFLSLLVFLGCTAKALSLYRTVRKRRYEVEREPASVPRKIPSGKWKRLGCWMRMAQNTYCICPKAVK